MEGFQRALLSRLPLATAVWLVLRHVVSDELAAELFEEHRGSGREGRIPFATLIALVADALLEHRGSGRRSFDRAAQDGRLQATPRAAYGKLGRLPIRLSQALLAEATARLTSLLPAGLSSPLPTALADHQVVALDGKKLKNFPKRMQPLRGLRGKLLGGKVAVAVRLEDGLAIAMEPTLDGEANDAPLTPALVEQMRQRLGPCLYVADRQFCDLTIPPLLVAGGDHFVIRYAKKTLFFPERRLETTDSQGRLVSDEWGYLGRPQDKRRFWTRRVTLARDDAEEVAILTDLLDEQEAPAAALLDLYRQRWMIERVFQQISEVFCLDQLIGSTPQGAIFQFAFCLLLYNVLEVVRAHVAQQHARDRRSLSSEMLFRDVRDQMTVQFLMGDQAALYAALPCLSTLKTRARLQNLLAGQWSTLWIKATKSYRGPPTAPRKLPGGHASAWKLLQQARQNS
jgi:Transposase DDE domain